MIISKRWIKMRVGNTTLKSRHADLEFPQKRVINEIIFLAAINSFLVNLGNRMDSTVFMEILYQQASLKRDLQRVDSPSNPAKQCLWYLGKSIKEMRNQIMPCKEGFLFLGLTMNNQLNCKHIIRIKAKQRELRMS